MAASTNSNDSNLNLRQPISPYLESLCNTKGHKRLRSATTIPATAIASASKLLGGSSTHVISYIDSLRNKTALQRSQSLLTSLPPRQPSSTKNATSTKGRAEEGVPEVIKETIKHKTNTLKTLKQQGRSSSVESLGGRRPRSKGRLDTNRPTTSQSSPKNVQSSQETTSYNCRPDEIMKLEEAPDVPVPKLKSILKMTFATEKRRPMSAVKSFVASAKGKLSKKNVGDVAGNDVGGPSEPRKQVRFYDKVEVHPVPYESRGSTEWQHNLMQARDAALRTFLSANPPPRYDYFGSTSYAYSNGGGSGLWGHSKPSKPRRYR